MANGSDGKNERGGLPPMPDQVFMAKPARKIDWKRIGFMALGIALFLVIYFAPPFSDAIDPGGKHFALSPQGKAALALFALAGTWWVFEVVPIGVTSILIGVVQALFLIRKPTEAFKDFMDPSVWFIFGSLVIGMVFTKTGLTKRMAYKMLSMIGENTKWILLGCFFMTVLLTHIMAHTAVAATVFPLFMAINSLYEESEKPTRFGKNLFMGMAFVAGAGSIITLLGSARAAVAIGFFKQMADKEVGFFELTYYMFPLGWLMMFLVWGLLMVFYPPEKKTIPGLRERVKVLHDRLGPMSKNEIAVLVIVFSAIAILALKSLFPKSDLLKDLDKSGIILAATVIFFVLKILKLEDLEELPLNIILLFGGAMSIGFCLWQTGAAEWMAVKFIVMFQTAPWWVFVLAITLFVMVLTNFIMNVAAIAITLPVALVLAKYLGVSGEVIFFSSLAAAGMPFMLLVGAAPNAIAYGSGQFTSGEFFKAGIIPSILLMVVVALFIWIVWPLMGMPVTAAPAMP